MSQEKKLTTNAGAPVVDNQDVMTAGPRGPALLQDADIAVLDYVHGPQGDPDRLLAVGDH